MKIIFGYLNSVIISLINVSSGKMDFKILSGVSDLYNDELHKSKLSMKVYLKRKCNINYILGRRLIEIQNKMTLCVIEDFYSCLRNLGKIGGEEEGVQKRGM